MTLQKAATRWVFSVIASAIGLGFTAPRSLAWGDQWVYVGTYTSGGASKGIYRCRLNMNTGSIEQVGTTGGVVNPSFLAIHPSRRFLYAVGEVADVGGKRGGAVAAFTLDAKTSELTPLNHQASEGAGPCHLAVDASGRTVLVANYGGGSVASLPILEDGRLEKAAATVQHVGKSVNPKRQERPHAHSINVDPQNRFAVAADLGLDKLLVYRLDAERGTISANDPPSAAVSPGAGPRHIAFHPNGRYVYVINELASTVTVFSYDAERGALHSLQIVSTLPKDFSGENTTAEVQVHPSGRFVYGSNRGHDSIAIFAADPHNGKLTLRGHVATGGRTPRNFGVDPMGIYLLAANQATDNIVVFRIDPSDGILKRTGHQIAIPSPVCVKFVPILD